MKAGGGGGIEYGLGRTEKEKLEKKPEIIAGNMDGMSAAALKREFKLSEDLRPGIKNPMWSCSLSAVPGEHIKRGEWGLIAAQHLRNMGLDPENHQYVVIEHHDKKYEHVHIYTSRVGLDGSLWYGRFSQYRQMESTPKLEKQFGLQQTIAFTPKTRRVRKYMRQKDFAIEKREGIRSKRDYLQSEIDRAMTGPAPKDVGEFVERLKKENIIAKPNIARTGRVSGFSFVVTIGGETVAFKGSQLGKAYTWTGLEGRGLTIGTYCVKEPSIEELVNEAMQSRMRQHSTFTAQDLAHEIFHKHGYEVDIRDVTAALRNDDRVVVLVKQGDQGATTTKDRFTTKEMLTIEHAIKTHAEELMRYGHETRLKGHIGNLSDQQKEVLKHITSRGDIKAVVGYAGTGKSYLLNEARAIWERSGYQVKGAALSGIAAEGLEGSSGIESRTIASMIMVWDNGERLTNKDILVIDEAGMVSSRQMERILREVKERGAKVVLVGDPRQLQAIEAGGAFRGISGQVGYKELTEVRRQREGWQKEATVKFGSGNVLDALGDYAYHHNISDFETHEVAKSTIVELWDGQRLREPSQTRIMLAYTRKDVEDLNTMARELRKKNHELGEDHNIITQRGMRSFAEGDRIYFLKNDRKLDVKNGTLGTIEKIKDNIITVRVDRDDFKKKTTVVRGVRVNVIQYDNIDHGYAATIHKSQGVTVDHSYIVASKHMDAQASYVGMTRHRETVTMYYGRDEFAGQNEFMDTLCRERLKDTTLDYGIKLDDFEREVTRAQAMRNQKEPTVIAPPERIAVTNLSRQEELHNTNELDIDTEKKKKELTRELEQLRAESQKLIAQEDKLLAPYRKAAIPEYYQTKMDGVLEANVNNLQHRWDLYHDKGLSFRMSKKGRAWKDRLKWEQQENLPKLEKDLQSRYNRDVKDALEGRQNEKEQQEIEQLARKRYASYYNDKELQDITKQKQELDVTMKHTQEQTVSVNTVARAQNARDLIRGYNKDHDEKKLEQAARELSFYRSDALELLKKHEPELAKVLTDYQERQREIAQTMEIGQSHGRSR